MDGKIQILIEPTLWLTFNKPGPTQYLNPNGNQIVVYGTAKNIAASAINAGLGGLAGGGWLQSYINVNLPKSLTLNRMEEYGWHTPPDTSGE